MGKKYFYSLKKIDVDDEMGGCIITEEETPSFVDFLARKNYLILNKLEIPDYLFEYIHHLNLRALENNIKNEFDKMKNNSNGEQNKFKSQFKELLNKCEKCEKKDICTDPLKNTLNKIRYEIKSNTINLNKINNKTSSLDEILKDVKEEYEKTRNTKVPDFMIDILKAMIIN